ncbi:MAG: sigma-70 family RNA polymerase sigma factor [Fuerstiella sp.]
MSDPFRTTRWSLVLAAQEDPEKPDGREAMETLCQAYWFPLYVYLRRHSSSTDEARDMTQAFFVSLLDRKTIEMADPDRGRFRCFLLTACRRFLQNEWRRQGTLKRGGQQATLSLDFEVAESRYQHSAAGAETPELLFERQWAVSLLDAVLGNLREEYRERGRERLFELLKFSLTGGDKVSYREIAEQIKMTEDAVKVASSRLKIRYRELLRAQITATVESESAVQEEIQRLFQVLASPA